MKPNDRLEEIRAQIETLKKEEQDIRTAFKGKYNKCRFYGNGSVLYWGNPNFYMRCAHPESELGWCGVTHCPLEY